MLARRHPVPFEEMPHVENPSTEFVATANNKPAADADAASDHTAERIDGPVEKSVRGTRRSAEDVPDQKEVSSEVQQ